LTENTLEIKSSQSKKKSIQIKKKNKTKKKQHLPEINVALWQYENSVRVPPGPKPTLAQQDCLFCLFF